MFNDAGPGCLPVGVVDGSVALEVGHVQYLRFKPDRAVLQRTQFVIKISIDGAGVYHLVRQRVPGRLVRQVVHPQLHLNTGKHILHHFGITAHGDALVQGIKVIIIEGQPHRQSLDNEGGKLGTGPSPLLLGVALHQLLINVRTHQGNGLLLQILRLGDPGSFARLLDLCLGLLRGHHTPHLVEGVHIEGQAVQFPMIIGHRGIGKAVEFRKSVYITPNLPIVSMENMGAIDMDVDALHRFGVNIAGDVIPALDDQHGFSRVVGLPGKHRAEQSRTHHQIIVMLHNSRSFLVRLFSF